MSLKRFKPHSRYSHSQLLVFALFFAAVGGFLLYKSFALNPNLPGDVNNDNKVDISDLSLLLSHYNQSYTPADFNSDSTINILDLSILLSNYNKTYTPNPTPPPPGGGGTAQIFISPSGNDNNNCTSSSPCRTLGRAYQAAVSGNTISIANGTYPGETLSGSKTVTFRVASGAASITDTLLFENANNITMYGPIDTAPAYDNGGFYSFRTTECSTNLELHDVSGRTFDISDSSHNIKLYGGSWGGYTDEPHSSDTSIGGSYGYPGWNGCGDGWVRDVVLDGVRFHDVQFVDSSQWGGAHPDCLESHGAFTNITIRNSVFERCGNTFIGTYLDWGSFSGLLIENNLMTKTTADTFYGIQLGYKPGYTCAGLVFRYNTYDPDVTNSAYPQAPPLIDDCAATGTGSTTQVYGNIFRKGPPGGGCPGAWSYNLFEDGDSCGSNAITGQAGFVSRGTDYHLTSGAFALGKGDPSRFPTADFEGTARSSPPDAGYDER